MRNARRHEMRFVEWIQADEKRAVHTRANWRIKYVAATRCTNAHTMHATIKYRSRQKRLFSTMRKRWAPMQRSRTACCFCSSPTISDHVHKNVYNTHAAAASKMSRNFSLWSFSTVRDVTNERVRERRKQTPDCCLRTPVDTSNVVILLLLLFFFIF